MTAPESEIGRIKRAMKRGKIMVKSMAKTVGVDKSTMSKYLNGTRDMPMSVAVAALESMGLEPKVSVTQ